MDRLDDELVAMRRVMCTAAKADETHQQRLLRKLMDENLPRFMEKRWELERAAVVKPEEERELDEGTKAAVEIAEAWLEGHQ